MSLAREITCKMCGMKFMDVFYECPNCGKKRDADLLIMQNELTKPMEMISAANVSIEKFPLDISSAMDLQKQGSYLYANRDYIRFFNLTNMGTLLAGAKPTLYADFALQWYKTLACAGDVQDAVILLLKVTQRCIFNEGRFSPAHLHSFTLICCLAGHGKRNLLEYLKKLSGNPNYVLPKINIQIEPYEWAPFIMSTQKSFPDVYDFVVKGTEDLPEI